MATGTPAVPPPPPRFTGDTDQDFPALVQWTSDFYRAAVLQSYFTNQGDAAVIAAQVVDPTQATAASAQTTANAALALAQTIANNDAGEVTISGASTTAVVATSVQPDTNFFVTFGGAAFTGAPAAAAFIVVSIVKTTTGFTLTLAAAPGVGNSVTLAWHVAR